MDRKHLFFVDSFGRVAVNIISAVRMTLVSVPSLLGFSTKHMKLFSEPDHECI